MSALVKVGGAYVPTAALKIKVDGGYVAFDGAAHIKENGAYVNGGAAVPPVNTVAPTITPCVAFVTPAVCDPGTWEGADSFLYQWMLNGSPISGATSDSFSVTGMEQVGQQLSCHVFGVNAGGDALAESNVEYIGCRPTRMGSVPAVDQAVIGEVSTCDPKSDQWLMYPVVGPTYQWVDGTSTDKPGETNSTYLVTEADRFGSIKCRVTFTNTYGSGGALSNEVFVS